MSENNTCTLKPVDTKSAKDFKICNCKNVTYFKNQPWGITDSHMIGFLAQLDGDDETVRIQEDEIVEARWFTPEEITPPANNFSLYSQLVLNFLATNGTKN